MYQAELDEARRLLDGADKDKARLEIRCVSLEEQLEELRRRLVLPHALIDGLFLLSVCTQCIINRKVGA
jgi:hypothetical protein